MRGIYIRRPKSIYTGRIDMPPENVCCDYEMYVHAILTGNCTAKKYSCVFIYCIKEDLPQISDKN